MSRVIVALAIIASGLVTAAGCRPSASPVVSIASPNAAALDARISKLEKDFREVAAARDAAVGERDAARSLARSYEQRYQSEVARAATLTQTRDALTASLRQRTAQHEQAAGQLAALRSGLRSLLANLDADPSNAEPLSLIPPIR